jgi:polar amino acid transport system substrate-binding protein
MRLLFLFFIGFIGFASANKLNIMTEEYPPYNYTQDGKVTGLATDIVRDIASELNIKNSIKMMKWAKAYNIIQKKSNQVLFVMTRTDKREKLFKWVGPVAENKWVLFARKWNNLVINSLDDAKKVKRIGTYKHDACETFLKDNGFKNLDSVSLDVQNVKKLNANRIDLWIVGEIQGYFKAKQIRKSHILEKVYDIKNTQLYIAFSKDTADSTINMWQSKLDKMKEDGRYKKILDRYLK